MMVRRIQFGALARAASPSRASVLLAFFAIYVIWGSTYLAIRYAVEGIPPLVVAGVRHSVAGVLLFGWVFARGYRPTMREWRASLVLGTLYFFIGHGSLHWAETVVPSGIAALLIGTEPVWIALMAALVSREERLTVKTLLGLTLGIVSIALLMRESGALDHGKVVVGCIVIVLGAISWAVGVIYSRSDSLPKDAMARASMAALCGSVLLLAASAVTGEAAKVHISAISGRALWALAYLIVFGSLVTFTAYTWLLDQCSPTLVSTHTYANPVIAVLLGWLFAGEVLDGRVLLAALFTLGSIFLINRGTESSRQRQPVSKAEAA